MIALQPMDTNKHYTEKYHLVGIILKESGKMYTSVTADLNQYKNYTRYALSSVTHLLPKKLKDVVDKSKDKTYSINVFGSNDLNEIMYLKKELLKADYLKSALLNKNMAANCSSKIGSTLYIIEGVKYFRLKDVAKAKGVCVGTVIRNLNKGKENWGRYWNN